jgi:hypothetical protein
MPTITHLPACRNDLCSQGHHRCPTPMACHVPDPADDAPGALRWLTPARFWAGYVAGLLCAIAGFAVWVRL